MESSMTPKLTKVAFSQLFDRAVSACAQAQRVSGDSASAVARARIQRASYRRLRALVAETLTIWAGADLIYSALRCEVERVAREMRESGVENRAAAATVRAHIRFVLYDGGLTERDAEQVVARASSWVDQIYAAA